MNDYSWQRIHWFIHGWGWKRGGFEIYDYQLISKGITNWLNVPEDVREIIVKEIKEQKEREERHFRDFCKKYEIGKFDSFAMPIIRQGWPKESINDLFDYPFTGRK
jgi:hypothetical protein